MTRQRTQMLTAAAATNSALGTLFGWSILLRPLNVEFDVGAAALTTVFSASLVVFAAVVWPADRHPQPASADAVGRCTRWSCASRARRSLRPPPAAPRGVAHRGGLRASS